MVYLKQPSVASVTFSSLHTPVLMVQEAFFCVHKDGIGMFKTSKLNRLNSGRTTSFLDASWYMKRFGVVCNLLAWEMHCSF